MRAIALALALLLPAGAALARMPDELPGWKIIPTSSSFTELVQRVEAAIGQSPLNVVFKASPNPGAAKLGTSLPGNMVIGAYAPKFAIRNLEASLPSGIEPPLRFYLTENEDGTSTLAYKLPSAVFAPYTDGGAALQALGSELDGIFATIALEATKP